MGDPGTWSGVTKLATSSPDTSAGRPQHRDLALRARDAADGLDELTLHESGALDLESQADEERRRGLEVGHGDADVVEALNV